VKFVKVMVCEVLGKMTVYLTSFTTVNLNALDFHYKALCNKCMT